MRFTLIFMNIKGDGTIIECLLSLVPPPPSSLPPPFPHHSLSRCSVTSWRPLRIEYPGALYHVTSRGDRQEAIFEDDQNRKAFLNVLGEVISRFRWRCHAYRLMGNHSHLMIENPEGNQTKGTEELNGVFTQIEVRQRRPREGGLLVLKYT